MTVDQRSLFWIEKATLTGLLATVTAPIEVPVAGPEDATLAGPPPTPRRAPRVAENAVSLASSGRRTDPEGAGNAESSRPRRAPLVLPRRPFEARLAALLGWLEETVAYTQAFVVDADGLPLVEETSGETGAGLSVAAAGLGRAWHALVRTGDLDARTSLALELGPEASRLHLLPAETRWGLLQLGFVTERSLGRADLDAARDAFRRTVDDKEHEGS